MYLYLLVMKKIDEYISSVCAIKEHIAAEGGEGVSNSSCVRATSVVEFQGFYHNYACTPNHAHMRVCYSDICYICVATIKYNAIAIS